MKFAVIAPALLILASSAFAGERLVIDPLMKPGKPVVGLRKSEQASITGPLRVVPMQGAQLTVNSTNFGQVILFSPMDLEPSAERKLKDFESAGTFVKVSGTLDTLCSEKQLKAEVMGCRRFDQTKPITIEAQ